MRTCADTGASHPWWSPENTATGTGTVVCAGTLKALPPGTAAAPGGRAVGVEPPRLGRGARASVALVLASSVALASAKAWLAVGGGPARPDIVDFHPFYLAGRMALEGHFADSYRAPLMRALERAFGGGRDVWTPFVYPPPFGLMMAPLALLPVGLAFLFFTASTLAFYLAVLRRLAGDWFWPSVLALSPVLLMNVGIGQNGLLAGGLAGLSAAAALARRPGPAGAAAGALAFKPQMATMLPLLFLMRRDGAAVASGAAVAVAFSAAAVVVLGTGTVAGFLSASATIAGLTATEAFPLHRMTSVYAFALGLGAPPRAALLLHGFVALAMVAASMREALRLSRGGGRDDADRRGAAGLILSATAFVSPYFFDYDLTVYGAGLALLLPALARGGVRRPLFLALSLTALGGASGLLGEVGVELWGLRPVFGAPLLLASSAVILGVLRRRRREAGEDGAGAPAIEPRSRGPHPTPVGPSSTRRTRRTRSMRL